ncbi:MAG: alpha/beta hydrolase [Archangium gephyra]|uniref:Alpha/beta hydrolase n=1 Tax=Archangium gephyra TaxID=48 RepID=A0A2W5UJN6_9BACT|nr:MAG: alpha/beta hydrolase [Archangium gephyra]
MKFELEDFGGDGPVLHFAHANGFPPGTYRKLLTAWSTRFHVVAVKSRCLQPGIPPSTMQHWETFADDLVDSLRAADLGPVLGVGHSLGGVATLIAASRAPDLFTKVIALDPVLFSRRDEFLFRALKVTGLVKRVGPAKSARKRREVWPSREAAGASYRKKPLFRDFDAECFDDYLHFGLRDVEGGVRLTIPRDWEARVFESGPKDAFGELKNLKVPSVFVRGESTNVFSPAAVKRVKQHVPTAQFIEARGGHLFPLEHPELTDQLLG